MGDSPSRAGATRTLAIRWAPALLAAAWCVVGLAPLPAAGQGRDATLAAQSSPRLVLAPPLVRRLQALADRLDRELVYCLTGRVDDRVTLAAEARSPHTVTGERARARFSACPDDTVALWHNHPVRGEAPPDGQRAPRPQTARAPQELCALSRTDLRTAASLRVPYMVISVDASTWCWFDAEQVSRALGLGMGQVPAPRNQLVQRALGPIPDAPDPPEAAGRR